MYILYSIYFIIFPLRHLFQINCPMNAVTKRLCLHHPGDDCPWSYDTENPSKLTAMVGIFICTFGASLKCGVPSYQLSLSYCLILFILMREPRKGKPHHFQNLAWLTLSLHHSLEQRPPYAVINIAATTSDVVTGELMSLLTSERVSALGSAVRLRDTYGYVLSNFGWRFIDEGRYQKGSQLSHNHHC